MLPENRDKNRYIDIMPYDATRFTFHPVLSNQNGGYLERLGGFFKQFIPGHENSQSEANPSAHSDYINANYVNMQTGCEIRRWIAAQGPLQFTVNDFWRMIHDR